MSIARQYGLYVDRVNRATDKEISAVVDRPNAKDAEIERLRLEVGRLTLENALLRAANMGANKPSSPANAANTDRKAYQRELMRKRRAAAKERQK